MNQLMLAEYQNGMVKQRIPLEGGKYEWSDWISFKYKTYGDTQHREFVANNQSRTYKPATSIKTSSEIVFKPDDKVYLEKEDTTYTVTAVERLQNAPYTMINMLMPKSQKGDIKVVHLNKDDV